MTNFPPVIRFEVAAACNLECIHCPVGQGQHRSRKKYMDRNLFDKIVDEAKDEDVRAAILYHGGEPFLNKDIFYMIRECKSHIGFVKTISNGMLMDEDMMHEITSSGLDVIEFSLDGISPEQNDFIRKGCFYSEVVRNIRKLISLKIKNNSQLPEIWIANAQFFDPKNPDMKTPECLRTSFLGMESHISYKFTHIMQWHGFNLGSNYIAVKTPIHEVDECDELMNVMTIKTDGEVALCCYDLIGQHIMGNINNNNVVGIWNNERFSALREKFKKHEYPSFCTNCTVLRPGSHLISV